MKCARSQYHSRMVESSIVNAYVNRRRESSIMQWAIQRSTFLDAYKKDACEAQLASRVEVETDLKH